MRPRLRALVTYAILLAAVFAAGVAGGFVFAHEPERNTLFVAYDHPAESGVRLVGGTVLDVRDDAIVLLGETGPVEIALPADVPREELLRAEDGLPPGTAVNVGVEQTSSGLVLTGIVAAEPSEGGVP